MCSMDDQTGVFTNRETFRFPLTLSPACHHSAAPLHGTLTVSSHHTRAVCYSCCPTHTRPERTASVSGTQSRDPAVLNRCPESLDHCYKNLKVFIVLRCDQLTLALHSDCKSSNLHARCRARSSFLIR